VVVMASQKHWPGDDKNRNKEKVTINGRWQGKGHGREQRQQHCSTVQHNAVIGRSDC